MMTAEHVSKLQAAGFTPTQIVDAQRVADVVGAMTFNWQALLELILQYGPLVIEAILKMFNLQPTPAPTPPTP